MITKNISVTQIDTDYLDDITCPYCGSEINDSWEYADNDDGEIHCDECENTFSYEVHRSVDYSTKRLKCKDGCDHVLAYHYNGNPYIHGKYNWTIYKCTKCFHEKDMTGPIAPDGIPYLIPVSDIEE